MEIEIINLDDIIDNTVNIEEKAPENVDAENTFTMSNDIISADISNFIDSIFRESLSIINDHIDFIEDNALREPKEDYLFALKFLNTRISNFTNLDHTFASNTLRKIQRDAKNLELQYKIHQGLSKNIDEILETKFLKKVPIYLAMQKELYFVKNNDASNFRYMYLIKTQYKKLKTIYLDKAKEEMLNENIYILNELKYILNTTTYYLDKMLWLEAKRSQAIMTSLRIIQSKQELNSKSYIQHRLSVDLPYSDDYKYMENCLKRTYK